MDSLQSGMSDSDPDAIEAAIQESLEDLRRIGIQPDDQQLLTAVHGRLSKPADDSVVMAILELMEDKLQVQKIDGRWCDD
jgi:hypothetical protein